LSHARGKLHLSLTVSSCQNSVSEANVAAVLGTYAYNAFDSSGVSVDSGILTLTGTDSMIGGQIHSQDFQFTIRGKISDSGAVEFSEIPEKILSPLWYGSYAAGTIRGFMQISTGGRPTPILKLKFVANKQPIIRW
jgi:hypothetical protein